MGTQPAIRSASACLVAVALACPAWANHPGRVSFFNRSDTPLRLMPMPAPDHRPAPKLRATCQELASGSVRSFRIPLGPKAPPPVDLAPESILDLEWPPAGTDPGALTFEVWTVGAEARKVGSLAVQAAGEGAPVLQAILEPAFVVKQYPDRPWAVVVRSLEQVETARRQEAEARSTPAARAGSCAVM
jgi:hypothetical protein